MNNEEYLDLFVSKERSAFFEKVHFFMVPAGLIAIGVAMYQSEDEVLGVGQNGCPGSIKRTTSCNDQRKIIQGVIFFVFTLKIKGLVNFFCSPGIGAMIVDKQFVVSGFLVGKYFVPTIVLEKSNGPFFVCGNGSW